MYVVYWDKNLRNRFSVDFYEAVTTDAPDYCIRKNECQWIVPGTVGVDD